MSVRLRTKWLCVRIPLLSNTNPNEAYNYFLHEFILLYDQYFPKQNIRINAKYLQSPWITRGIKKTSKPKQRLYVNSLKKINSKNEFEYRNYKKLFVQSKNTQKRISI